MFVRFLNLYFVLGFCLWAFSKSLAGEVQPWDGFLYLVVLGISPAVGFVSRAKRSDMFWGTFLGMWAGQVLAIAFVLHLSSQGWIVLGMMTTAIGAAMASCMVLAGTEISRGFRADSRDSDAE
ncbi:hypothetical protein [Planctomicrobium piriforme]|uniref:hypothetical protein n=1 Tax=Planctomicrobium piriforme TaxID=1576369 RepID=UPI000B83B02B|nr:hypothetical protein [Planctomicrobium piriforme]